MCAHLCDYMYEWHMLYMHKHWCTCLYTCKVSQHVHVRSCAEADGKRDAAKETASALASLRRLCQNPQRCTLEILQRWRGGTAARKDLLKTWLAEGQDAHKVSVQLILEDELRQL